MSLLLKDGGIDVARTRHVRHQARSESRRSPYDLWQRADGSLEEYQRLQGREVFGDASFLCAFVATPLNETLFVGLYRVLGKGIALHGTLDPLSGRDVGGAHQYDLERHGHLAEYAGRMVVDWGLGFRSWVQRAERQDKPVIEIRQAAHEPPFPGFDRFGWTIGNLPSIPRGWRAVLSAVGGVYLLTSLRSGERYVGSAWGAGGFWARWESYFRSGHGGNEGMKLLADHHYRVAILEVASSTMEKREIEDREAVWKAKLLTREFGLNRN